MNLKEQMKRDVKAVFHNTDEFAEEMEIYYDGEYHTIPVILDYEGAQDRKKPSSDNAGGIFRVDVKLYVAFSDLNFMPRQGASIEIGDDIFNIVKVGNEAGEIILDLESLDE
ncbi:hypothetical protein [Tepidibacter formicigenes]|jgi:hypothetical protein|uniref:ATP-binding sugar transporter n=1 Tax=Tepidibacter formicigenes DSM 15518 TaxID=1123349 RepID=A0A1M6LTB7_9FIRM|nr:hypothetical protein [Tepidibacter formicigenes]SHJ74471.1 hypothetical protein SAMN02744037_00726 [Tepidibacter formicigenes DSM 15518]